MHMPARLAAASADISTASSILQLAHLGSCAERMFAWSDSSTRGAVEGTSAGCATLPTTQEVTMTGHIGHQLGALRPRRLQTGDAVPDSAHSWLRGGMRPEAAPLGSTFTVLYAAACSRRRRWRSLIPGTRRCRYGGLPSTALVAHLSARSDASAPVQHIPCGKRCDLR
jgi:hypothetical protein